MSGGDTWRKTGEVVGELAGGYARGVICAELATALCLIPVGWVAIAGTVVAEAILISITSHYASAGLKKWLGRCIQEKNPCRIR